MLILYIPQCKHGKKKSSPTDSQNFIIGKEKLRRMKKIRYDIQGVIMIFHKFGAWIYLIRTEEQ